MANKVVFKMITFSWCLFRGCSQDHI